MACIDNTNDIKRKNADFIATICLFEHEVHSIGKLVYKYQSKIFHIYIPKYITVMHSGRLAVPVTLLQPHSHSQLHPIGYKTLPVFIQRKLMRITKVQQKRISSIRKAERSYCSQFTKKKLAAKTNKTNNHSD